MFFEENRADSIGGIFRYIKKTGVPTFGGVCEAVAIPLELGAVYLSEYAPKKTSLLDTNRFP